MTRHIHHEEDGASPQVATGLSSLRDADDKSSSPKASIPSADDFNTVWDNQPPSLTRDKPIEICVVAKRCVYLNNRRVAGGKPWAAENLPHHVIMTKLGEVLDAFTDKEIRAALREKKARADYFAEYHRRKSAASAIEARQGGDASAAPSSDESAARNAGDAQ